jgi:hypothetical protein
VSSERDRGFVAGEDATAGEWARGTTGEGLGECAGDGTGDEGNEDGAPSVP